MEKGTPLLELTGITKNFGGISVLTDLALRISDKEIVGILGPNGAGKSNAARNRLSRIVRGDISGLPFAR